jgi:hypothetical protein
VRSGKRFVTSRKAIIGASDDPVDRRPSRPRTAWSGRMSQRDPARSAERVARDPMLPLALTRR